jgi:predicted phosphodiesterase
MNIKLISDLHLEFGVDHETADFSTTNGANVLVLAGDVAVGADRVSRVLEYYSRRFANVVYVPGNHEYYGSTVSSFDRDLEVACAGLNNVHVLNPGVVEIDGVLFVGATLWTNFHDDWAAEHAARSMISDFKVIKDFCVTQAKDLFYDHWDYVAGAVEGRGDRKCCVVTHFLPAQICIAPEFQNPRDLINYYFANSLDNWIYDSGPDVWMFGHTHVPVDVTLGNTRLVCNPRGYPNSREGRSFNPHFKVTL